MGALIRIRDDTIWKAQEPTFSLLVEGIVGELELVDQPLAFLLKEALAGSLYLDLTQLQSDRFRTLFQITRRFFNRVAYLGPSFFTGPQGYVNFVFSVSELLASLRTDERAEGIIDSIGVIAVSRDEEWTAPAWILDLVLEHFAGQLYKKSGDCAVAALKHRIWENPDDNYNLDLLDEECLQSVTGTVDWLYKRYGDAKGRSLIAPALNPQLAAYIIELRALINGPRT